MDPTGEPIPIEKAPYRIQREHYRRERRNSILAVLVLVALAGMVAWGALWLMQR